MILTSSTGEIITVPDPAEEFSCAPKKRNTTKHLENIKTMAPARTREDGFDVSISEVPVTEQRRPFIQKDGEEVLKQPGMYIPLATMSSYLQANTF